MAYARVWAAEAVASPSATAELLSLAAESRAAARRLRSSIGVSRALARELLEVLLARIVAEHGIVVAQDDGAVAREDCRLCPGAADERPDLVERLELSRRGLTIVDDRVGDEFAARGANGADAQVAAGLWPRRREAKVVVSHVA